jgi:hypothetical protein
MPLLSAAFALALSATSLTPARQPSARPAPAPRAGHYGCYFNNYPYGISRSSIQWIEIASPTTYREPRGAGSFAFDPADGRMHIKSGPLAGRIARSDHDGHGKPAITFSMDENKVNGKATIDISGTMCYLGAK